LPSFGIVTVAYHFPLGIFLLIMPTSLRSCETGHLLVS
jgi:hypothetical protein